MEIGHNTKIYYFTVQTNQGRGYICMAMQRPEKGSTDTTYRAAFSCYSPNETESFSKSRARNIALGRLKAWRFNNDTLSNHMIEFNFSTLCPDPLFKIMDVVNKCLREAVQIGALPRWVVKASKNNNVFMSLGMLNGGSPSGFRVDFA